MDFVVLHSGPLLLASALSNYSNDCVLRAKSGKVISAVEYSRKYLALRLLAVICYGVALGFPKLSLSSWWLTGSCTLLISQG